MANYILYFDNKRQPKIATSAGRAIQGCWAYLKLLILSAYETNSNSSLRCWVSLEEPADAHEDIRVKAASKGHAKYLLEIHGRINLFAESNHHGIFEVAAAIEQKIVEKQTTSLDGHNASISLMARLQGTNESLEQHLKKLARMPSDNMDMRWDKEATPEQILSAAEERIFQLNLYRAIENAHMPIQRIEERAELAPGTIQAILSGVKPLRPRRYLVEQLASILGTTADRLWYDAVVPYELSVRSSKRPEG